VRDWVERNLGPVGRLEEASRGVWTLAGVVADLPELALRTERVLARLEEATGKGLALHPDSIAAIGRAEAHGNRWGILAVWVLSFLLLVFLVGGW
jgi:ubiquinone biosynthesis protein